MTVGSAPTHSFFGWRVLGAAFTAQFVANSLAFSAFGVFVTEIERDFGTDRATLSSGFGVAFLVSGLLGPVVGRLVDRSVRGSMLVGTLMAGGGLATLSRATELWQLGVGYCGLVIVGVALCGPIPSMALVGRWFVRRRGLTAAIAVAGATLSSAVAPATAAWLIETQGWRFALAAMGAGGVALALPVFALFVKPSPEAIGQHPDGDAQPLTAHEPEGQHRSSLELARERNFLVIAIGMGLLYTSPIVFTLHFVPFAESLDFSKAQASLAFTALAVASLTGKVVFGALIDRVDARLAIWAMVLFLAGGWAVLATNPGYELLMLSGALLGLGIGPAAPIQAVLIGRCFGRTGFGHVMGLSGLVGLPMIAGANPLAGALYVATGSYRACFLVEIGLLFVAGLLFLALRIPQMAEADGEVKVAAAGSGAAVEA